MRVDTERARRARHAVQRRLEMARQVVMLEWRGDEKHRVQRNRKRRDAVPTATPIAAGHYLDDTPALERPQTGGFHETSCSLT